MAWSGLSPFYRQCFVVLGVAINLSQYGLVFGFTGLLLPQLERKDSTVVVDGAGASWIASLPCLGLLVGNIAIPTIMGKLGRKRANIISITIMIISWSCIIIAKDLTTILVARFFQGVSIGMANSLSPIVIGECTSPRNRGAFLTALSLVLSLGTLLVHTTSSFLSWRNTAVICTSITVLDLLLILLAPESPSWLAVRGRFEEAKTGFRWLRGYGEDEEMHKMIEASIIALEEDAKNNKKGLNLSKKINELLKTIRDETFYKPIFIGIHVYGLSAFSGINVIASYIVNVSQEIAGMDVNIPLVVITIGVQRLITNSVAIVLMKKIKRRTMLLYTTSLTVMLLFVISGYNLAKNNNIFENSVVGVLLIHLLVLSISLGALPLTFVIVGELYSMKYRSLSGGLSSACLSMVFFSMLITFQFLFKNIGLHGTFFGYGCLLLYCLVFLWIFLPETKDKTLQQIEEGFKKSSREMKTLEPLMDSKI